MKSSIRVAALAFALATGTTLVVPLALPAGAAVKPSVVCTSVSSGKPKIVKTSITLTSTLSKCTPAALAAGGTETIKTTISKVGGTIAGSLLWKGGKGKTAITIKFSPVKTAGKCAKGTSREKITGKTGATTGTAATTVKKGEPVSASICAFTSGPKLGQSSLEPGTTFKL